MSISILCFQNCAPTFHARSPAGVLSESLSVVDTHESKIDCQFVGPEILSDRLRTSLDLADGDVPVLDDSGSPMKAMRIATNIETLGQGDLTKGRADNMSCGTSQFKAGMEVMIDACAIAMTDPKARNKFFPSGLNDFTPLYLILIGREPTSYEVGILNDLIGALEPAKAEAGACAAVASSFESLIRI